MSKSFKNIRIPGELSINIINDIRALALTIEDTFLVNNIEKVLPILVKHLGNTIIQEIKLSYENNCIGFILIEGLANDVFIPPTPYVTNVDFTEVTVISAINLALCKLLKVYPVTYQGENNGELFRHVMPIQANINGKTSQGSKYPLGMHVDNCYLPLTPENERSYYSACPEFMSLFGLRHNVSLPTKIIILDEVLSKLGNRIIAQLKKPEYIVSKPDSFSSGAKFYLPLLVEDNDGIFYGRFDQDFVHPTSNKSEYALNCFIEELHNSTPHNILVKSGDCLLLKNQRVMHGRDGFLPKFDGTDRWMLRVFGVSNLSKVYHVDKLNPYHVMA